MRLAVFAYDFPHRRTQDFLVRLFLEGHDVQCVLGAPWRKLKVGPAGVRTKIRHRALLDPRVVAERLGFGYHVAAHNSDEAVARLRDLDLDLGVVAGARILKPAVIAAFGRGIVNLHPGLIPESRGLDAMLWSVRNDVPLGVTAHLIDEHVDAGAVLLRRNLPIRADDGVLDLTERNHEMQLELLTPALEAAASGEGQAVDPETPYNKKMTPDLEQETLALLPDYIQRHAGGEA